MKVFLSLMVLMSFVFSSVLINSANEQELTNLKGVGLKKAQAIVKYRELNGCFKNLSDLNNVVGLGSNIIKNNQKMIVIKTCEEKKKK